MAAIPPLIPFLRFIILRGFSAYGGWSAVQSQFQRADEVADEPIYGYYSTHIFQMKDGGAVWSTREQGQIGFHWVNTTDGDLDTTWTDEDFEAVEAAVETFLTSAKTFMAASVRWTEHRWYAYGPEVASPNPVHRVKTLAVPIVGSSATTSNVYQVGSTVTFRTALRRHWGRVYVPITSSQATVNGQFGTGVPDNLCDWVRTLFNTLSDEPGIVPVIWDRNRGAAMGISAIEADSVPDIQRPRRPRTPAYRRIYDTAA